MTGREQQGAGQLPALSELACIVVTYHPELSTLRAQFDALPAACALVIVDNASGPELQQQLAVLGVARRRFALLRNRTNLGLAAAINLGVEAAHTKWPDVRYALLLDQDSEPHAGSVEQLLQSLVTLTDADPPAACVGPALHDLETGLFHGFHQMEGWRWQRIYPDSDTKQPVPCQNLNGSGTLVSIPLFQELGGLEEELFIDHVDTEWAFRVLAAGYGLYGIPDAVFDHRMGAASQRIWMLGWRVWPMRSPLRHYYLYRNATRLIRRDYVPLVWKLWAVPKLLLTALVHSLIDPERRAQLRAMLRGIRDGLGSSRSHRSQA